MTTCEAPVLIFLLITFIYSLFIGYLFICLFIGYLFITFIYCLFVYLFVYLFVCLLLLFDFVVFTRRLLIINVFHKDIFRRELRTRHYYFILLLDYKIISFIKNTKLMGQFKLNDYITRQSDSRVSPSFIFSTANPKAGRNGIRSSSSVLSSFVSSTCLPSSNTCLHVFVCVNRMKRRDGSRCGIISRFEGGKGEKII